MGLLDKFETVEVSADKRLSEADIAFCRRQQLAYEKMRSVLLKIADLLDEAIKEQHEILKDDTNEDWNPYWDPCPAIGGRCCDGEAVRDDARRNGEHFASTIVSYFRRKYHVELDSSEICNCLGCDVCDTVLRYESIVDAIFVQMGGYSFEERAMHELLKDCWDLTHIKDWRTGEYTERFTIKGRTLRLNMPCVRHNEWLPGRYDIPTNTWTILEALGHYSGGKRGIGDRYFPELYFHSAEGDTFVPAVQMDEVKQIKLFKNGHMAIEFRDAGTAKGFAKNYLRQKVEEAE